jgi:hypothetical protein
MKHLALIFVIFLGINVTALASYYPPLLAETPYAEMFDSVFKNVSRIQATTGILYERSVPFANLVS